MTPSILFFAQATAPAQPQGGGFQMFLPMILMFVLFYFIAIRPQRQKQQELAAQIAALKGGDHIVTTGGLYGVVSSLQEKTLTLKIADNVKIKLDKAAVAAVVKKSGEAEVIDVSSEDEKA